MKQQPTVGVCELCGARASKAAMPRHLTACAPAHDSATGTRGDLLRIRAEGRGAPLFWIDLEIKGTSPLRRLDELLRRVWLECCGHMSAFEIAGIRYSSYVDNEFGFDRNERSMNIRIGKVLEPGQRVAYEYDFGSTTELVLRVLDIRSGVLGKRAARLLARNEPPTWPCATCGQPATVVCAFCIDDRDPFCCARHAREHSCEEDEAFLPVINSPRMGVCGYTGEV